MAPEMFAAQKEKYSSALDIFSFSITLFEMIYGVNATKPGRLCVYLKSFATHQHNTILYVDFKGISEGQRPTAFKKRQDIPSHWETEIIEPAWRQEPTE